MSILRGVKKVFKYTPTMDGAGVKLRRAFGFYQTPKFDPFLLLDEFHSDKPEDYINGFSWHPHRGIETVTYILEGSVVHEDSLGNKETISAGGVQWMTAGKGIIHQEMPEEGKPGVWGFQLWINLSSSHKMIPCKYQDINASQVPVFEGKNNCVIKIIAGKIKEVEGPVKNKNCDPEFLDIIVPPNTEFRHKIAAGRNVFAYVYKGAATFMDDDDEVIVASGHSALFSNGDSIFLESGGNGIRFLLLSGLPIKEPIAWSGPIVMNTDAELRQAFKDYEEGTFLD